MKIFSSDALSAPFKTAKKSFSDRFGRVQTKTTPMNARINPNASTSDMRHTGATAFRQENNYAKRSLASDNRVRSHKTQSRVEQTCRTHENPLTMNPVISGQQRDHQLPVDDHADIASHISNEQQHSSLQVTERSAKRHARFFSKEEIDQLNLAGIETPLERVDIALYPIPKVFER